MINPPSFIEVFKKILDSVLFHPATPTEFWVTLGAGLLVMLLLIFQLQIHFGAARNTLPVALAALVAGLGIIMGGAIAIQCYVFPILPENFLPSLNEKLTALIGGNLISVTVLENIFWGLAVVILFFAAVCPVTAALCYSSQFAAAWSWIFSMIAGITVFFGVHAAFLHFNKADDSTHALREAVEKHREELLKEERR